MDGQHFRLVEEGQLRGTQFEYYCIHYDLWMQGTRMTQLASIQYGIQA